MLLSFAQSLHKQLASWKHVALIAHKAPDGDAYGSLEGMKQLLISNYPHLSVTVVVPREKQLDTHVNWILSSKPVELIPEEADVVLFLDASPLSRTALDISDYPKQLVITLDHHEPQADSIGGYRDTTAASTTTIITDLARSLEWIVSPESATALLLGVYTDTGGFIHRNSNQHAFDTAAFLMNKEANQSKIAQEVFGNHTITYLHDLGKGLLSIIQEGNIACLFFPETDNNSHLKSNIIGYLSGLANVDIACVLMQKGNIVKGSLRTRKENVDVNELAKKLGGGGHKKASGFELENATVTEGKLFWKNEKYSEKGFIQLIQKTKDKVQN